MNKLDHTHDPALQSWVHSANAQTTDFPIQNLPFGRFKLPGDAHWRVGVAIGDSLLDLQALGHSVDILDLLQLPPAGRRALRHTLSQGLRIGAPEQTQWQRHLHSQHAVTLGLPCDIGDVTDFYVGIHHATRVGKLFRPDTPLLPNYRWVPIAYHGRASTLLPSGQPFMRPRGQIKHPDHETPVLAATARLDFELEMGVIIGQPNALGAPISLANAEDHVFGLTLFNDWSARDIQAWEYQPLGPFLGKNFASTISPWVVTPEALAPFRSPLNRPPQDAASLDYLESAANRQHGAFDISLEVWLQTSAMHAARLPPARITCSNFAQAAYWTVAQMITHHTINGCALRAGDVLGTGTLSGAQHAESGSLLELTAGGTTPIELPNGEARRFLEDGDCVTLKGSCQRAGFRRIGFGECVAEVLPATRR